MAYKNKSDRDAYNKAYYVAHRDKLRAYKKAYEAAHKDELRARNKAAYAAHKDERLAYNKAYYAAHRLERLAAQKAYNDAHKDEQAIRDRAYYAGRLQSMPRLREQWKRSSETYRVRHPQRCRDIDARRRVQELAGIRVAPVDFRQILCDSKGLCGICKKPLDLFGIHFDHIVPLARGGTHTHANIQAAHAYCNRSKGSRLP